MPLSLPPTKPISPAALPPIAAPAPPAPTSSAPLPVPTTSTPPPAAPLPSSPLPPTPLGPPVGQHVDAEGNRWSIHPSEEPHEHVAIAGEGHKAFADASGKVHVARRVDSNLPKTVPMPPPAEVPSSQQPTKPRAHTPTGVQPAIMPPHEPQTEHEKALHGDVHRFSPLGGGINASQIVHMTNGAKGVWKPARGEYIDPRTGQGARHDIKPGSAYLREAAASHVARELGMDDLVPPTTRREINGEVGSVQRFEPKTHIAAISSEPYDGPEDHARAAAFDYLLGHTDRHEGNWMLTDKGLGPVNTVRKWAAKNGIINDLAGTPKGELLRTMSGDKLRLIDNGYSIPNSEDSAGVALPESILGTAARTGMKIPDLSHWAGKWPVVEKAMQTHGIEPGAIAMAKRRFDALVSASKAGGTFGDLSWGGNSLTDLEKFLRTRH